MSRTDRWLFGVLVSAAILVGVNMVSAATGWINVWRAFDDFNLRVSNVRVLSDHSALVVDVLLSNGSHETVHVLRIETAVDLNGHTVALGGESLDSTSLAENQQTRLSLNNDVSALNIQALNQQLGLTPLRWDVSGQVQIEVGSVEATTTWIPFAQALTSP